jgi:hypothetical protein
MVYMKIGTKAGIIIVSAGIAVASFPNIDISLVEGAPQVTMQVSNTFAAGTSFKDVKASHWAKLSIESAVAKGYFKGYADGTFRPSAEVTKEEFAALLSRVSTNADSGTKVVLPGTAGRWSEAEISLAVAKGFINPQRYVNGFNPQTALTRIDMIRWMVAGLSVTDADYGQAVQDMADTVVPVAEFYKGLINRDDKGIVALAVGTGLVAGYEDGSFGPNDKTSRAEVAVILLRLEQIQKKKASDFQVVKELREIGLTGTNVASMGFAINTQGANKPFTVLREAIHPLTYGYGTTRVNRLILVDPLKLEHPLFKMFIGSKFSTPVDPEYFLAFTEMETTFTKTGIDSFIHFKALANLQAANGSGFDGISRKNYAIKTLPTYSNGNGDYNAFFPKDKTQVYWQVISARRFYKIAGYSGIDIVAGGVRFWAKAPVGE